MFWREKNHQMNSESLLYVNLIFVIEVWIHLTTIDIPIKPIKNTCFFLYAKQENRKIMWINQFLDG